MSDKVITTNMVWWSIKGNKEDIIVILKGGDSNEQKFKSIIKYQILFEDEKWKQKDHRLQSNMFHNGCYRNLR